MEELSEFFQLFQSSGAFSDCGARDPLQPKFNPSFNLEQELPQQHDQFRLHRRKGVNIVAVQTRIL